MSELSPEGQKKYQEARKKQFRSIETPPTPQEELDQTLLLLGLIIFMMILFYPLGYVLVEVVRAVTEGYK